MRFFFFFFINSQLHLVVFVLNRFLAAVSCNEGNITPAIVYLLSRFTLRLLEKGGSILRFWI